MQKVITVIFLMLLAFGAYAQNGVIRELSGTVEAKAPGAASFTPLNAGDQVSQDTVISTGFKSTALVEVGSSLLTVRPLTRLTLTEIRSSAGAETLNVNLQAGRVRVDVTPPAGTRASMSVSSLMATASVRGTSFEFDTRNVKVSHGIVSFAGNRSRSSARLVNAGYASRVEDGKTVDPIKMRNSRLSPPAVAGTGSSGSGGGFGGPGSGSPVYSTGTFWIELYYPPLE
jgi:hypothetical protein